MPKSVRRRSVKAGLPPGTLVHVGEKKVEEIKVTIIDYDEAHVEERVTKEIEECFAYRGKPGVTWINLDGLHRVDSLEKLGDCFGLHPLILEDILNTEQRPKIDDLHDYISIVLKMLYYNDRNHQVEAEQVSLVLGSNFVLSFQEREGDVFNAVRERIKGDIGRIRKMGADYLLYSLIDAVVDNYFLILEKLGEKIESLEDQLIADPTRTALQTVHQLRGEMISLRRSVWPLREVISSLEVGESPLIKDTTRIYLRDIYDHTVQAIDTIETNREIISGMIDIYLSSVSNRLNEVMKVLTIIATIFIPLTFIVGVYGMNFRYMPELDQPWGYYTVIAFMALVGALMLAYFRRRRWI